MSRPLRIEFPDLLYHVTAYGSARQNIFPDNEDWQQFLAVVVRVISRFYLLPHAYCLMDNHLHLVVETPEGNMSKAMYQLNGVYTQAFYRRRKRVGHVAEFVRSRSDSVHSCR
jgi:putative transposase